ncbi:MAG: Dabb family protein [Desulfobacteraceae bacterium]|nr:Dabb family protein [Desulfobacteraceae bacterium]
MIKHIVMWTLVESDDKEDNLKKMKSLLEGLVGKIDEIVKLEVAIHPISSPEPLDIVLYSEFNSYDDLNAYATNPKHLKVVEFIKSVSDTRSAVDYEV